MLIISCAKKPDVIFSNAKLYSLDNDKIFEAAAVKDGIIIDLGSTDEILKKYHGVENIDLKNKTGNI